MELTQRIRELTALPGVSGQEDAVREYLLRRSRAGRTVTAGWMPWAISL